ncbi:hypothetical protein PybrP1_002119, partial [[Pythium] brassicae (nom. inval.)]
MSISVSRESISKLMTELVDTFPIESEGRSSISDFGKLLFTEGQGGAVTKAAAAAAAADSGSARTLPPSDEDENADDDNMNDDDDDDDDDDEEEEDEEDEEQSAIEDAKIAGAPSGAGGQKRVFTEIKGVPRQKQPDVQCVVAENGKISLSQSSVRKIMKSKDKAVPKRWTQEEDDRLREAVGRHGERNWKSIAEEVPGRNHTQCLQRWTKVLAPGLVKGHWRPDEDELLKELVAEGRKNWGQVATRIPGRTSKQCRERWYNHLDPSIVRGEYTAEEDRIILEAQSRLGNRWSAIAAMLPGRTEDAVKIRWKSLCRVRKGQGARRSAQGGDKGRASTPKAGGSGPGGGLMMAPPPHHLMHHHAQQHHHHHMHSQLHAGGGGSFSGGPIVKSEELGAFPTSSSSSMRAQQQMSHLQYASAMSAQQQQQQQQMSMGGGGYHVMSAPQPTMVYASDMATVYDPSTGQYRKQPTMTAVHAGYGLPSTIAVASGDAYSLDRRANVVTLSTPTQGYRGGAVAVAGYATAPTTTYATDMDGNLYAASATSGGYPAPMPASSSDAANGKSPAKNTAPFNPAAISHGGGAKPAAINPVAAFLQQQQKTNAGGSGASNARPPFNPAAAFAQRFQTGKPPMPAPSAGSSKGRDEPDDDDEDTENGDKNGGGGAEPSLKKVKPRLSIDAARASAARRMRSSGGGAALAGRGSLDVFLNEIGDVGRLSDLKMDEFQTLDELWRVSDDMNRTTAPPSISIKTLCFHLLNRASCSSYTGQTIVYAYSDAVVADS